MSEPDARSTVEKEHEDVVLELKDGGYARVVDSEPTQWLSVIWEGNIGHILCVTDHRNGVADGEEIPTPFFEELVEENGVVFEEPPGKVKREVNRLERI